MTLPYVPRVNFGRRLEPPGDHILHGAGQDAAALQQHAAAMSDQHPLLFMAYIDLTWDIERIFTDLRATLAGYHPYPLIPQIGVAMLGVPVDARDLQAHQPNLHYEQAVADGHYDVQIDALCQGLQQLNRPVFLWTWADYPIWSDWGDARIWINDTILARYRHELSDELYLHAAWCPSTSVSAPRVAHPNEHRALQ